MVDRIRLDRLADPAGEVAAAVVDIVARHEPS
jgi:hypothetical protein